MLAVMSGGISMTFNDQVTKSMEVFGAKQLTWK